MSLQVEEIPEGIVTLILSSLLEEGGESESKGITSTTIFEVLKEVVLPLETVVLRMVPTKSKIAWPMREASEESFSTLGRRLDCTCTASCISASLLDSDTIEERILVVWRAVWSVTALSSEVRMLSSLSATEEEVVVPRVD